MPKQWAQMSVEEKLDNLNARLEHLVGIMNLSAARGNGEFTNIDRRLSPIERTLDNLGAAARGLLDKAAGQSEAA